MSSLKIIIVTYNAEKFLYKLFLNLKNLPSNYEIIVVDNNSNDSTVDTIKRDYNFVRLIELDKNLGFGKGNNIGLKIALEEKADNVLLLNQDAYIDKETIENLIQIQNNNPDFYIISPLHYDGSNKVLDTNFAGYLMNSKELLLDAVYGNYSKDVYESPFVNAACWLLNRECLLNIGGFSPVFYHYAEDNNYVDRVLYHNKKVGIAPSCKVIHDRYNRPKNPKFDNEFIERYRSEVLVNLSNPANNFHKRCIKVVWRHLRNIFKFNSSINDVKFILLFISNYKSLKVNRAITITCGPHFLEDEN